MENKRYLIGSAVLLSFLLLAIAGCRKAQTLKPEEVIERASAATSEAKSFHFTVVASAPRTPFETQEVSMEGDFQSPDRMRINVQWGDQENEIRYIGDKVYIWKPHLGWHQEEEARAAVLGQMGMQGFIASVQPTNIAEALKTMKDVDELPEETIEGVRTVHYTGKVDRIKVVLESWEKLSEGFSPEDKAKLKRQLEDMELTQTNDLWIGKEDYLVRHQRTVVSSKMAQDAPDKGTPVPPGTVTTLSTTIEIHFPKPDEAPVEIEAPPLSK